MKSSGLNKGHGKNRRERIGLAFLPIEGDAVLDGEGVFSRDAIWFSFFLVVGLGVDFVAGVDFDDFDAFLGTTLTSAALALFFTRFAGGALSLSVVFRLAEVAFSPFLFSWRKRGISMVWGGNIACI